MSEEVKEAAANTVVLGNAEFELNDLKIPQYVMVENHDSIVFMECVVELCNKGFTLDKSKFPHLKDTVLSVNLVKDIDINKWEDECEKSRPFIRAMPLQLKHMKFEKDYINSLSWVTFKNLMKACGITGRDRNKMTTQYMKLVENV